VRRDTGTQRFEQVAALEDDRVDLFVWHEVEHLDRVVRDTSLRPRLASLTNVLFGLT
jgi:hypothetical protein